MQHGLKGSSSVDICFNHRELQNAALSSNWQLQDKYMDINLEFAVKALEAIISQRETDFSSSSMPLSFT